MSSSLKRSTIEGMPSPAARGAESSTAGDPAFRIDVLPSLRRHPRVAAAVALVVLVLMVVVGLTRQPVYNAESLTYVEPLASKVLSDASPSSGAYDSNRYDSYLQQQTQTALRPDILEAAIRKLPPFVWQNPGESMQSAVTRLQAALKVQRVSTSYQLSISLSGPNSEAVAATVNAVTNTYLEQGRKDEHAAIDQRLQLLGDERQRIQQKLDEDRLEQASLRTSLGLANPTGLVANPYDAQIAGVQTQVAGAREARDVAAAQLESLQGGNGALEAAADEVLASDAGLNAMKETINSRKAVLNTQMAGMTPANPVYKQDQAEIADLDNSLNAMTTQLRERTARRLQEKMRTDLARTAGIEDKLNAQLNHEKATATSAAPLLQRATDLAADVERLNTRYGVVDDAMRSLQLESNGPGSAHLSVAAVAPVSPEPSKRKLIFLLALPLALFAGTLAALLVHRLDPKVYTGPDVEKILGFQPIGVMPARAEVSGPVAEEYTLRLAAGLQNAYRTSSAQSFVFTAASSAMETGEFVRGIERLLGSLGFRAIVIDAAAVLHGGTRAAGGAKAMTHRSSALIRTIDGVRQGFAAEEIERLKLKYDLLLIDAPPLLHSAETEYLVRCTDATILIAESGVTAKNELHRAARLLQQLNVAGVGAVLQELHLKDADKPFQAAIEAVEEMHRARGSATRQMTPDRKLAAEAREGAEVFASPDADSEGDPSDEPPPEGPKERRTSPRGEEEGSPADQWSAQIEQQNSALDSEELFSAPGRPPPEPAPEAADRGGKLVAAEPEDDPVHLPQMWAAPDAPAEILAGPAVQPLEELPKMRSWKEMLNRRAESTPEPVAPPAPEPVLETASREPEPVLYFQDRLRPKRNPTAAFVEQPAPYETKAAQVAVEAAIGVQASQPEEQVMAPLAGVESFKAEEEEKGIRHEAGDEPEPWAWRSAAAPEIDMYARESELRVEKTKQEPEPPAQELPALHITREKVIESVQVDESFQTQSRGIESAWDRMPDEEVDELGGVDTVSAEEDVEGKTPLAGRDAFAEPAEIDSEADSEIWTREPAPPKMEWFTLKFRGTSERVLRIVPGDEQVEPGSPALSKTVDVAMDPVQTEPAPHAAALTEAEIFQSFGKTDPAVHKDSPSFQEDAVEQWMPAVATDEARELHEEHFVPAQVSTEETPRLSAFPAESMEHFAAAGASSPEPAEPESLVNQAQETAAFAHASAVEARELEVPAKVQEALVSRARLNLWAVEDRALDETEAAPDAADWDRPPHLRMTGALSTPQERNGPTEVQAEPVAEDPARFAPVRLVEELRRRAGGSAAEAAPPVQGRTQEWRSAGAPVEERLEKRPAGLTRRWEMLSRFDQTTKSAEAEEITAGDKG